MACTIREAINIAYENGMKIELYGSLQYRVSHREDESLVHSRLVDSLQEAIDIIPDMRQERRELAALQSGDVVF